MPEAPKKPSRLLPKCAASGCPHRVKMRVNKHCSKRCAWMKRRGWEISEKGRQKALAVNRAKYVARLRERLRGVTNVAQVWQMAYRAGFNAGYQVWLRREKRGEIAILRARRDREVA